MKPGIKLFVALSAVSIITICIGIPSKDYLNSLDSDDSIESEGAELQQNLEMAAYTIGKANPRLSWAIGSKGKVNGETAIKIDIAGPIDPSCLAILQFSTKSSFEAESTESFLVSAVDFRQRILKPVLTNLPKDPVLVRLKLDCSTSSDNSFIKYSKKTKLPAGLNESNLRNKNISAAAFIKSLVIKALPAALSKSKKIPAPADSMQAPLMAGAPVLISPLIKKEITKQRDSLLQVLFSGSQPISVTWVFEHTNPSYVKEIKNGKGFETSSFPNGASAIIRSPRNAEFRDGTFAVILKNRFGDLVVKGIPTNASPFTPTPTPAQESPTAQPTAVTTPIATATRTAIATPTRTPNPTATNTPTGPTPIPTRSATAVPTATRTSVPTATRTATPIAGGTITLACDGNAASEGVTSVLFKEVVGSTYILKGTSTAVSNPSVTITGLSVGSHTFVAIAVNPNGESAPSLPLTVNIS
jgi:hypothetical protein